VKFKLEEGQASFIVREVEAHRRGGATLGHGRVAARWDFRAAADLRRFATASRWYYSMRRKKGRLDSEESTREWPADGAHWRGKLGGGGGSDSDTGSGSLVVGADKRSSGGCRLVLRRGRKWRGKLVRVNGEKLDGGGADGF
jgi:hypothetical protein